MLLPLLSRQLSKAGGSASRRILAPGFSAGLKPVPGSELVRIDRRFAGHGHHHEEPPHYAYRGDGLPDVKCEELQQMLHINERLRAKKAARAEPEPHPTAVSLDEDNMVDPDTREVFEELKRLYNKVLTTNWHDTVQLTMNMDIWVGNLERLRRRCRDMPHVHVQELLSETLKLFDVLFQVEDLQDHLYELMEELAVNAGEGGSPENNPKVTTNMNTHITEVMTRYQELKQKHPEYTEKFKESLGYTLAVLRQRYTFDWPEEHHYFY